MLHIFPSFTKTCRCLCNKSWCLMLRHVQLFATPRTAYIYLDLSFCFLCRTSKILFHGFLYAIISDFKKPFIIRVTVLLSVTCTLSLAALSFLPLFFSSLTMIWWSMISFTFIPLVAFLGSWFYRLIVLFSANLGTFFGHYLFRHL